MEQKDGTRCGRRNREILQFLKILGFTRAIPSLQFLGSVLSDILDEIILLSTALRNIKTKY